MKQCLQYPNGRPTESNIINKKAVLCLSLVEYSASQLKKVVEKLLAQFGKFDVVLFDSVQRYNLMWTQHLSADAAHQKAVALGNTWLTDYANIFNNDAIKMFRWDEWLSSPRFAAQKKMSEQLYHDQPGFKESVDTTAADYLTKYAQRHSDFDGEQARALSVELIKEEAAGILLAADLQYDFDVSFRKKPALKYLSEHIIHQQHPELLQPIVVTTHVKNRYEI